MHRMWDSPIGVDAVASSQISFQELHVDGDLVFWTESRPLEKGRHALTKKEGDGVPEQLFSSMSIQSKVHEYGGGAFALEKGLLVFFDLKTFSLYVQKEGSSPVCLACDPTRRFADFAVSPDLKTVLCICEDHTEETKVRNFLVAFDLATLSQKVIHEGFDFYASPRWSPDGKKIAFISWNFPAMPWEESSLKILSSENFTELCSIGAAKESISQFIWTAREEILFASDRSGFSNLYFWNPQGETPLHPKEADFAPPLWILGRKNFASLSFEGAESFVVNYCERGVDHLGIIDRKSRQLQKLNLPYTVIKALDVGPEGIYFVGGSPTSPLSLIFLDLKTLKSDVILASSKCEESLKPFISEPKEVSTLSSLDQQEIFGFFYPPKNPSYESVTPPLIIKCHSGPTAHAQPLLSWDVQFWTSRGFAFLEVNYRGSSGFGRKYREALNGNWGLLDVQDCLDLAQFLVRSKIVDKNALFAKGGSAGGFTALCMAAAFPALKGCVSLYGVTDLSLLAEETHKFEKTYLDFLVGSYKTFPARYTERSPSQKAEKISCPVLFLHGSEDRVVSLAQARALQMKLPRSNLIVFEGEGHGFRRAETIKACLEAEAAFYQEILKGEN